MRAPRGSRGRARIPARRWPPGPDDKSSAAPSWESGTILPRRSAAAGAGAAAAGGSRRCVGRSRWRGRGLRCRALAAAAAAAPPFSVTITSPALTVPPLAMWTFSTTPLAVEGTSMAALSDSSVTSGVSTAIASPGLTSTSMTATSLKLPRSGTRTSVRASCRVHGSRALQTFQGTGLSGSTPSLRMARVTVAWSTWPSSESALSAATTMWLRSTSKKRRSAARASERP